MAFANSPVEIPAELLATFTPFGPRALEHHLRAFTLNGAEPDYENTHCHRKSLHFIAKIVMHSPNSTGHVLTKCWILRAFSEKKKKIFCFIAGH